MCHIGKIWDTRKGVKVSEVGNMSAEVRVCDICGSEFAKVTRKKRCSEECKKEALRIYCREWHRKQREEAIAKPLECQWCGDEFFRDSSGPGRGRFRRYCSDSCSRAAVAKKAADHRRTDEWRRWYQERVDSGHYQRKSQERRKANPNPVHSGECEYCGAATSWVGKQKKRRTCDSEACKRQYATDRGHARRVKIRGTSTEFVSRVEIFNRDEWVCQLCSEPIDKDAAWPDGNSPVIDHIVPISRGGSHTRDNLQTAHAHCNAVKSDRMEDEISNVFK